MTNQKHEPQDMPKTEKPVQQPEQELSTDDLDEVSGGLNGGGRRGFRKIG